MRKTKTLWLSSSIRDTTRYLPIRYRHRPALSPVRGFPCWRGLASPETPSWRKLTIRFWALRSSFLSSARARGSKLAVQAKPFHHLSQGNGRQILLQPSNGDQIVFLFVQKFLNRLFG